MSIPAKDTHLAAINHHLRAVAIVFDFVNPVLAFWRLIDRGSKLRLDEPEAGSYAKHLLKEEARTVMPGLLPLVQKGEMMMAGEPSPRSNYHLTQINQPDVACIRKPRRLGGPGFAACARRDRGGLG